MQIEELRQTVVPVSFAGLGLGAGIGLCFVALFYFLSSRRRDR